MAEQTPDKSAAEVLARADHSRVRKLVQLAKGDKITVVAAWIQRWHQTKFGTNEPEYHPNGLPKETLTVSCLLVSGQVATDAGTAKPGHQVAVRIRDFGYRGAQWQAALADSEDETLMPGDLIDIEHHGTEAASFEDDERGTIEYEKEQLTYNIRRQSATKREEAAQSKAIGLYIQWRESQASRQTAASPSEAEAELTDTEQADIAAAVAQVDDSTEPF